MIVSIPELYWWCCALTTMRLSLWFVLILAFSVGMCCALAVRFLYFEAMPVVVQASEPTTRILVATRTIPSGIEITADFVSFQEVPISEVPPGVLTSFSQVYRRQPAFPIPVGCPICEDLLLPRATITPQTAFVPTGNQIVALDITHVRQGNRVFLPREPLSAVLSDDQRIDIRVVPPEAQGRLAEKRNEVLRTFAAQDIRNSGELILENVPIHKIQRQSVANHAGSVRDALELMLDKNDAARLTAAARRGQLRIFVRQDEVSPLQLSDIFDIADSACADSACSDSADASVQTLPDSLPSDSLPLDSVSLVQSLSLDIPNTEHSSPTTELGSATQLESLVEPPAETPVEHVQRIAPVPADVVDPVLLYTPAVAILPLANVEDNLQEEYAQEGHAQNVEQPSDSLAIFAPLESPIREVDFIRNDGMIVFGMSFRSVDSASIDPATDTTVEQTPTQVSPLMDEPGQGALARPSLELAIGSPRITNTIQFLPPGSIPPGSIIVPVKEDSQEQERMLQVEAESAIMPIMSPIMPSAMPILITTQDRTPARVPGYSPFERRIYTVLPEGEEWKLQAPQQLTRGSDSGTPNEMR